MLPPPPPRLLPLLPMPVPMPPGPKLTWGRNDALFRQFLTTGFQYQRFVADFLLAHGIPVILPRMRMRGSIRQAHHFKDEPDIVAAGRVLEVKSRSLTFQRTFDLPSTVLLDSCEGHDGKVTTPFAYIIVSQPTGAMLWTSGTDTHKHWTVLKVKDSKRGTEYTAYAARRFDFEPMHTLVAKLKAAPALGMAAVGVEPPQPG